MNLMSNCGTGGHNVNGSCQCRHEVCNENNIVETLPHIRGACPKTELMRNAAHHRVSRTLANLFRSKNLEIYEQVHYQTKNDNQNCRADYSTG